MSIRCPLVAAGSGVEALATPCRVRRGADGSSAGPRRPLRRLAGALPQRREAAVDHAGVACHALHPVEARLACCLLLLQDRVDGGAALPLTQELLAEMLAVQRTTVTAAARALQQAGLIAYKWGSVTVLDRAGLEEASCRCHRVIREHYERVSSCIRG